MIAIRVLLLLSGLTVLAAAATPIGSLAEVRALTAAQAAGKLPVMVEGTVLGIAPFNPFDFMLHDGTTACFIRILQVGTPPALSVGSRVRVVGVTDPSGYFPSVGRAGVTVIGTGELPVPALPSAAELFSPGLDSQWVEVPAVVVGYTAGKRRFTLDTEVFGLSFKAELPHAADTETRAATLMQRPVRMRGVLGTIYNKQRQMTERHFFLASMDALIPLVPLPGNESPPLLSVGTLLTREFGPESLVRIQGVVTQGDERGFYLRGHDGSTLVVAAHADTFSPGAKVAVEGFGAMAPFRPILRATRVSLTGTSAPPPPVPFAFESADLQTVHAELVTMDASYLGLRQGNGERILQCQSAQRVFDAILPAGASIPTGLSSGDQLQLTGICELTTTQPLPRLQAVNGFRLRLPASGGVQIVERAPWWTPNRLLLALVIATSLSALAIMTTWVLRRQVKHQLDVISAKLRAEAVGEERDRMARELHDSLEQQLAGVSLQLDGLEDIVKSNPAKAPAVLALLRRMLGHTRKEARRSVWDLRSKVLEKHGLGAALQAIASGAPHGHGPELATRVTGQPRPLPANVEFHLLRIAQEAVANALKHSGAKSISITLDYSGPDILLAVQDDGSGFAPDATPAPGQHFGLLGMRERAARIGGHLAITSAPGSGCTITVTMP